MVACPAPQRASTGSGCRNSRARSGGTTSRPSGLPRVEASLARNLLPATPTVRARPASSRTRSRSSLAAATASPNSARAPRTSRNASSRASGSTSGVTPWKMRHDGGRVAAVGGEVGRDGHRLRAQAPGPGHRHGVAAAERPGLVGGRGDHPAAAGPADQQRAAAQGRVLEHLDAGVEGVQVGVEDAQPVGLARAQRPAAGDHLTGRPHLAAHGAVSLPGGHDGPGARRKVHPTRMLASKKQA